MTTTPLIQDEWIKITNNFTKQCVECGEWIEAGETVLWLKGLGIKHEECSLGLQKDETMLIILDQEDKERLGLQ